MRLLAVFPLAVIVVLGLFYVMVFLILPGTDPSTRQPFVAVDFVAPEPEKQPLPEARALPEPPEYINPAPLHPGSMLKTPALQMPAADMRIPEIPILDIGHGLDLGLPITGGDAPLDVLVAIKPQYPRAAALQRIQGWVKVEFIVDVTGTVSDASVIAAEPRHTFNREALRAIRAFKFIPRQIGGKPVSSSATQVIKFELEKHE